MASERSLRRCRNWYARLIRLYPKPFRERFGEGMEQTFCDLCHESVEQGRGLFRPVLWMFFETSVQIAKENAMSIFTKYRNVVYILLTTGLILTAPLVAMQYTDEVNWTAFDFVAAATLLIGSGLMADFFVRKSRNHAYRTGGALAVATGLVVVWVNLAVGIIGNEDHPANELFFVVLLIGMVGAFVARYQARGMSIALFATAIAQALAPVIALTIWSLPLSTGLVKAFTFNTFIALSFATSARLFARAAREAETEPTAMRPAA
jgi:hypothetical protein